MPSSSRPASSSRTSLRVQGVSKQLGGRWVLRDVDLALRSNGVTAVIGPNGAGKTTLFHVLDGQLRPDRGQVLFGSADIAGWPPWRIARAGIGRLFQDVRVFRQMSVRDNVLAALPPRPELARLSGCLPSRRARERAEQANERAASLLDEVGLAAWADDLAGELSAGQRKLLALARLLAMDPDVLLLDEPTAGLHADALRVVEDRVRQLAKARGKTVVLIEHDLNVVARLADDLHFMHEGRIAFSGAVGDVLDNPQVRRLYMGL